MVKRLPFTVIAASILFYILFAVLSKATSLDAEKITFAYIPLLLLTSTGYLIRLARWIYFLRITGTGVDMKRNILIFFAGLVASITPAKAGEIVKSGFLAKWHPVPGGDLCLTHLTHRDIIFRCLSGRMCPPPLC
jgi:hypothetical protein